MPEYLLPICLRVQLSLGLGKVQVWVISIGWQAWIIKWGADKQAQLVTPANGGCPDCALASSFILYDVHLCQKHTLIALVDACTLPAVAGVHEGSATC